MNLNDAILKIVNKEVSPQLFVGKVTAFNSNDWTLTCDVDDLELDGIRVKAIINSNETGILVEPKVGSQVLLAKIENKKESLVALQFDEVVKYRLNADLIELNGDDYSIVKAEELQQIMQTNKAFIDAFKNIVTGPPITQPANSTSTFQTALAVAIGALDYKDGQGIENETVKHG
jgi:hypothetical protein